MLTTAVYPHATPLIIIIVTHALVLFYVLVMVVFII